MARLTIILDPERVGIGHGFARAREDGSLVHLADDAQIVVSGLEEGMRGGKPSMMFGFVLPDGTHVIAETSWRLFKAAYLAFAGKFGEDVTQRPDVSGLQVEYDATGDGRQVRLDLVADDEPQFFECELCGHRVEEPPGVEGAQRIAQAIHRHYREKHPHWPTPETWSGRPS